MHPGSTPLMGGGAFGTGMQRAAMHAEEDEERGALVPPEVTLDQFMVSFMDLRFINQTWYYQVALSLYLESEG